MQAFRRDKQSNKQTGDSPAQFSDDGLNRVHKCIGGKLTSAKNAGTSNRTTGCTRSRIRTLRAFFRSEDESERTTQADAYSLRDDDDYDDAISPAKVLSIPYSLLPANRDLRRHESYFSIAASF